MLRPQHLAVAALVASLASRTAHAQTGADALSTGIYARAGFVLSSFDPGSMTFLPQRVPGGESLPGITGKQFGFREMALAGFTSGVAFDARWFFVRVGADIYEFPAIRGEREASFRARFTTLAWVSAGPRLRVGPVVLNAGVRLGALLMNATEAPTNREYSAVGGVFALDVGAQWRPLRWLELDASVGQDFFSQVGATTFSVTASFGWSRGPTLTLR